MTPQRAATAPGRWSTRPPEEHLALSWSAALGAVLAVLLTVLGMAGVGGAGAGSV